MQQSNALLVFQEERKLELIDTMGQIEALAASVLFKIKNCVDNDRLNFYIETLFGDLLGKLKLLIDELITAYERLTER